MKQKVLNIALLVGILLAVVLLIVGIVNTKKTSERLAIDKEKLADAPNLVFEDNPRVTVNFSDVIVGTKNEVRKLVVIERAATVEASLNEKIIKILDIPAFEKNQKVKYTGLGRYLVDLDAIDSSCVIDDADNKILTIKIPHAYLESVEIDPYKIKADDVEEGFFARGNIKLSVEDYNTIMQEIKDRMEAKLKVAQYGQEADEQALKEVKEIYEPVVKAIDNSYEVVVEFK